MRLMKIISFAHKYFPLTQVSVCDCTANCSCHYYRVLVGHSNRFSFDVAMEIECLVNAVARGRGKWEQARELFAELQTSLTQ